jgi:hypothetical protein
MNRTLIYKPLIDTPTPTQAKPGEIFFDTNGRGYYLTNGGKVVAFTSAPHWIQTSKDAGFDDGTNSIYYHFADKQFYLQGKENADGTFSGDLVWTAGNFNPSLKANLNSPVLSNGRVPTPSINSADGTIPNTSWVNSRVSSAVATGTVLWSATPANNIDGWLLMNGQAVSRTQYATLFAMIGTGFGAGDGTTTFNLPNAGGYFIRGWDDGRGVDAGRALNTFQAQAIISHTHIASMAAAGQHNHSTWTDTQGWHGHGGTTDFQGQHQHVNPWGERDQSYARFGYYDGSNTHLGTNSDDFDNYAFLTSGAGGHSHNIGTDAQGIHGHNITVAAVGNHAHNVALDYQGAEEFRPVNIAFRPFVKY